MLKSINSIAISTSYKLELILLENQFLKTKTLTGLLNHKLSYFLPSSFTARKHNKTVSHTLVRLKNICFVGRAAEKSTSVILLLFM